MPRPRRRSIIVYLLHDRYPPRLYVFLPLYRFFRRRLGIPMVIANLLVWLVSALLHGGVLLGTGNPIAALEFAMIFVGLGLLSSLVVLCSKRTARL